MAESQIEGYAAMQHIAAEKRENAYAPYSGYKVGAAILAENGKIYGGCNVENAAYPQSSCAEAGAIAAMIADGARRIKKIYILGAGKTPVTPCGGCRQRIREFAAENAEIISQGMTGAPLVLTLADLLPHAFGPDHLKASK